MFLQFVLLHLLIIIYPGPGFFALVSRSTYTNYIQSSLYGFGMSFADSIWCLVGLLFFSTVESNIILFKILKLLGGCYLIYMGVMMIIKAAAYEKKEVKPVSNDFIAGFLMAISNPKAVIFFSNLLIQFVKPEDPLIIKFGYILWIFFAGGFSLFLLAELFKIAPVKRFLIKKIMVVDRVLGSLVILFAVKIMFF